MLSQLEAAPPGHGEGSPGRWAALPGAEQLQGKGFGFCHPSEQTPDQPRRPQLDGFPLHGNAQCPAPRCQHPAVPCHAGTPELCSHVPGRVPAPRPMTHGRARHRLPGRLNQCPGGRMSPSLPSAEEEVMTYPCSVSDLLRAAGTRCGNGGGLCQRWLITPGLPQRVTRRGGTPGGEDTEGSQLGDVARPAQPLHHGAEPGTTERPHGGRGAQSPLAVPGL